MEKFSEWNVISLDLAQRFQRNGSIRPAGVWARHGSFVFWNEWAAARRPRMDPDLCSANG